MAEWLTEYTHTDGTKWVGPRYEADTFEEAQALAMEYPIQPMRVIGEYLSSTPAGKDSVVTKFRNLTADERASALPVKMSKRTVH